MEIKKKIFTNIIISVILIFFLLLSFIITSNTVRQEGDAHDLTMDIKTTVFDLNILLNDYLTHRGERPVAQWDTKYNSGLSALQKVVAQNIADQKLTRALVTNYLDLENLFKEEVANHTLEERLRKKNAPEAEIALVMEKQERAISQLMITSQSVVSLANVLDNKTHTELDSALDTNKKATLLLVALLLIITTIISIKTSRDILKPLLKLRDASTRIGEGKFDTKIETGPKDEIGDLAKAFNEMTINLKKAEEELLKEKNRLDATIESLPGVFYLFDSKGKFLRWNKSFERVAEYTSEEMEKAHPTDFFRGNDKKHIASRIKEVFTKGESDAEANLVSKSGKQTPYYFTGKLMVLNNEPYLVGMGIDIKKRKEAEEKTKIAKDTAETYLHVAGNIFVSLNTKGEITLLNKKGYQILGYNTGELINKNWFDTCLPKKHIKEVKSVFKQLMEGKTKLVEHYENPVLTKDGKEKIISWYNSLLKDRSGNIIGVLSSGMNVTEQRIAEEKLKDRTSELAKEKAKDDAILQSIGDAVVACDINGKIIIFNKVAQELTGYSPKQALGKDYHKILKFINEDSNKKQVDSIKEALKSGKPAPLSNHTLLVQRGGNKIPVADSSCPVLDSNNNTIGCVVVFRDVTRELEIDKMKTEFVSVASHQLRTPLTILRWALEELLEKRADNLNKEQLEHINEAWDANNRMRRLVNDLLNVARLETGRLSLEPKSTDITELVQRVVNDQQISTREKKHKITISLPKTKLPKIKIDPILIHEALTNILSNSIKYTPITAKKPGKINIKIAVKKPNIEISIRDNGVGIPKKDQVRVFEKFFRADNIAPLSTQGTGLGLYITKLIVETSGGKVCIKSPVTTRKTARGKEVGTGTLFKFTLPLAGSKARKGERGLA